MNKIKNECKYQKKWEEDYWWIQAAQHLNAFCKACNVKFKINNSGISQVKSHAKGVTHQDKERVRQGKTNQRVFVISSESEELTLSTSKTNLVLTNEDKVIKAETIQALDFIQSNCKCC